jgi:cbb3-type cytochrome oxidase subunit 3
MFRAYFSSLEFTVLPLFGLGLFLLMFVLILLRTFAFKRKSEYDLVAALPLDDGTTLSNEVRP